MPVYQYTAKSSPTETREGILEAGSPDAVVSRLHEMGLIPVSVVPLVADSGSKRAAASISGGGLAARMGWIGSSRVDVFARQLGSLIGAGVSIVHALDLIAQQEETGPLRGVVTDIRDKVMEGMRLSEAAAKYPAVFDRLFVSLLQAGEAGGVLDEVLPALADYRERDAEVRRKVQASLAYPAFILVVGIMTVIVAMTYFLPNILVIFENSSQALPTPTRILVFATDLARNYGIWLAAVLALGAAFLLHSPEGSRKRLLADLVKLHLPVVRTLVRHAETARFARTLALLHEVGIPVHQGLEVARNTVYNEAFRRDLGAACRQIVEEGTNLADSFAAVRLLPAYAVHMIAVGEAGGTLSRSLREVAELYERQVDHSIRLMTALLEPALMLVIGGTVGCIVFAMLLPIFEVGLAVQ